MLGNLEKAKGAKMKSTIHQTNSSQNIDIIIEKLREASVPFEMQDIDDGNITRFVVDDNDKERAMEILESVGLA